MEYLDDVSWSQEDYASIDFTLRDHPSTSVASDPEFTAPLLPGSSLPLLDSFDGSGNAEEAHFHSHGRPELHKDMDCRKEKALHASSANIYIQGGENPEPKLSSSQLHIPVPQGNVFSSKQSGSDNLQAQRSTSGNRVGDEVNDYFEPENLSQQAQQLEHARQQQAQQLEQHSRQQQPQQLLAGDKQNLGNQFSLSPYGSFMHNGTNFMHSGGFMSQMASESYNPSPLPYNIHQFNAGSLNGMLNCSPSVTGLSTEALLSQDPYSARQDLTLRGSHLDPSVYGSLTSTTRDAVGQPLNLYPGSQVAVQELSDTANKIPSAANHQVGKPVVRAAVLGASVLGNCRTSSLDPTSAENDGKQKALGKSSFGQGFSQNFTQPSETPQGITNFPQGTTIPRNFQLQDFHLNQHNRSWTEDIGQKENFQEGPSQVLVNSDAPSESRFYNSQPSGWHSVHSSQVVATSDSRIQNTNAGQYVHQGSYQMGNADMRGSLAPKPPGSWSALMQSAVAVLPSGEADQDDWSSLSLQKTEAASGDYLPLHSNQKQESVWSEQNVPVSSAMNEISFNLWNGVNSQLGVQSVQGLQQSGSEVGGHLESKHENIQHDNQIKLQPRSYSQFLQETPEQIGGFRRNPNADNQVSNAERYEQATESNYQLGKQRKSVKTEDIFYSLKDRPVVREQRKRKKNDQDTLLALEEEFPNVGYKKPEVDLYEDFKVSQYASPYSAATRNKASEGTQIKHKDVKFATLEMQIATLEKQVNQLKQKLKEQQAIEEGNIDQQNFASRILDLKNATLEKKKLVFQQLKEFYLKIEEAKSLSELISFLRDERILRLVILKK